MKDLLEAIKVFLNIDDNTAATILITLSVLILGYIINGFVAFIKSIISKYRNGSNILNLISEINKSVSEQIKNFTKMSQELDIDVIGLLLRSVTINHLSTFKEITYKEFKSSFVSDLIFWRNRRELSLVNDVYKSIDYLRDIEVRYPQDFKEYISSLNKYESEWDSSLESLRKLYDEVKIITTGWDIRNLNDEQQSFVGFLKAADVIWYEWQEHEERLKFSVTKDILLDPLLQLCRDNDSKNDTRLRSFDFILGAIYAYNNMQQRTQAIIGQYISYGNNYDVVASRFINFKNSYNNFITKLISSL